MFHHCDPLTQPEGEPCQGREQLLLSPKDIEVYSFYGFLYFKASEGWRNPPSE